jgi:hypothetical protein
VGATGAPGLLKILIYDFEEGSGTTTRDSSPGGVTLALSPSGVAWTTSGHTGNALSFDGSSGSVSGPYASNMDLTTSASVEAWVLVPTAVNGTMTVAARVGAWRLALVDMSLAASFETAAGPSDTLVGSGPIAVNQWSHVAAVYDGLKVRTYVNGIQTSQTTFAGGPLKPATSGITVGSAGSSDYFSGRIDELRVSAAGVRFPGTHRGNVFCGPTAAQTGNMGGWAAARALCVTACGSPTAHVCDAGEIAQSWQFGAATPGAGAWVASTSAVAVVTGGTGGSVSSANNFFTNYRGCCIWDTGQTAVTGVTLPSTVTSAMVRNCAGWTSTAGYGQIAGSADFSVATCSTPHVVACCD